MMLWFRLVCSVNGVGTPLPTEGIAISTFGIQRLSHINGMQCEGSARLVEYIPSRKASGVSGRDCEERQL